MKRFFPILLGLIVLSFFAPQAARALDCPWFLKHALSKVLGIRVEKPGPKPFTWKKRQILSLEETGYWRENFTETALPYLPFLERAEDSDFFIYVHYLPAPVRAKLAEVPADPDEAETFFQAMRGALGLGYASFPTNFAEAIRNHKNVIRKLGTVQKWLAYGEQHLRDIPAREYRLRMDALAARILDASAGYSFRHDYQIEIAHSKASTGKIRVSIGDATYEGKVVRGRSGDELVISAPVSRIKHPSWNPVDVEHAVKIAQSGTSAPAVYRTVLGLDGYFYLLDGNHRFFIYGAAKDATVKVGIPFPVTTASLAVYLDLIGVVTPGSLQRIELLQGKKKLSEVLSEETVKKIIFMSELEGSR